MCFFIFSTNYWTQNVCFHFLYKLLDIKCVFSFSLQITGHKMCVFIFSTNFVCNITHSKRNSTRYSHKYTLVYLTPADFYLFLRLKSQMNGRRFCDARDIIKNGTDELKRVSKNGFQESL